MRKLLSSMPLQTRLHAAEALLWIFGMLFQIALIAAKVAIPMVLLSPVFMVWMGSRFYRNQGLSRALAWRASAADWPNKVALMLGCIAFLGTGVVLLDRAHSSLTSGLWVGFSLFAGVLLFSLFLEFAGRHYSIDGSGAPTIQSRDILRWSTLDLLALGCGSIVFGVPAVMPGAPDGVTVIVGIAVVLLPVLAAIRGVTFLIALRRRRPRQPMARWLISINAAVAGILVCALVAFLWQMHKDSTTAPREPAPGTAVRLRR